MVSALQVLMEWRQKGQALIKDAKDGDRETEGCSLILHLKRVSRVG